LKTEKKKLSRSEKHIALWRRGILHWKFKPIQKRLYQAYHAVASFLFVSLVARQTGKSFHWTCLAIETALQKPNARIRYGTAFQSDLEEFILPIFRIILEDCPADVKPSYKVQAAKWVFPNGSEIKLIGLDLHPDGIRGNALDLVIIDEAGFVDKLEYVFSIIIFMLRHRPELRVVMSSSAPETPDHEFVPFLERARHEEILFEATIDDDETCPEEVKDRIAEECGGKDSTTYRRECMCELVVDSDLAIIPEWDQKFIQDVPRDDFYKYYHRYVGQDIGGTKVTADFTAHIYGYYDFKRAAFICEDETCIRGPQSTTDNIALMVREKEKELWHDEDEDWNAKKVYRRISDNNNPILVNDLGVLHGIHFRPTNKDELPAMVNDFRLLVKQGRFLVHPRCKMTIGCLRNGIYNSKKIKREFARSKTFGHYDHLAAGIYLVRNLDEFTNPIPTDYGTASHTHHKSVYAKKEKQAVEEILGKTFITERN